MDPNYKIFIGKSRAETGAEAAKDIALKLKQLLAQQTIVRMVFASAPSQNEMLKVLVSIQGIEWSRVEAFHMDEYLGLAEDSPQRFSKYLEINLFNKVKFNRIELFKDEPEEYRRYSDLILERPIDIVCLGIGENGHIAFNDPPVADFSDPEIVKVVELDAVCKQQQVNDGCFPSLDKVPVKAYTLTIPILMSAGYLFCTVPGESKQKAVYETINNQNITTLWPSTVLRSHSNCKFYFDIDSARLL